MFLHVYLIHASCLFFIFFVMQCQETKEESLPVTEPLPLNLPMKSLMQGNYKLNVFNEDFRNVGYNNVSNETTFYAQNQYLKGYSLRTPKHKLLERGTSTNKTQLERDIRMKRGVTQLYNMISCATGCDPLSYKGYGCFCGLFGSGYPVDGIDRCCKMHDWCYDAAKCPMYVEYFVPYYWKCWNNNRPFCALDHGNLGVPGSCADKLCECDRALSECLRKYPCPSRRAFCRSSPYRFLQNAFMLLT